MHLLRDDCRTPSPVNIAVAGGTLWKSLRTQLARFCKLGDPDRSGLAGHVDGHEHARISVRDRRMVARLVAVGKFFDIGITGLDLLVESGLPLEVAGRLPEPVSHWALAAVDGWLPRSGDTIGCELNVRFAPQVLAEVRHLPPFQVVPIEGYEEWSARDGLCQAVLVVTETGKTLGKAKQRILPDCQKLFRSVPVIVARRERSLDVEEILNLLVKKLCT